jgi:PIN domain nuclease of toxin-antitoxin system
MRLLLGTHILLWALDEPERLDPETRDLLEDPGNEIFSSAASIWEIAIKARLGRADCPVRPEAIIDGAVATGFAELPIRTVTAALVATLPLHHRDPFDRLLVAQAIAEPLRLFTVDAKLALYSELVTVVR